MYARYGKRTLDIVLAASAGVMISLPLLLVAILIRLESRGPAIFKQPRYGKDKKPFMVYKFRTMATDAPSDVATNSFTDSLSYITRVGRVLRKLSIDELPQILNVLKGDMSIVGPRPVVLSEHNLIALRDKYGANSVKPGITGWAQVNGRDELDDKVKARMDGQYVDMFGLKTDIECLLRTIWVIGSAAGHSETQENKTPELASLKGVRYD